MKFNQLITFIILFFSLSKIASAGDHWEFSITPYLWNASVDANLSSDESGGDQPINPEYRFFSLDNLDGYLALQFEANRGRYSLLFDALRVRFQDETGTAPVSLKLGTELGFVELSGRYQLLDKTQLDLIAGIRKAFLDLDLTLTPPGQTKRRSFTWTDPLVGLRYRHDFTRKWYTRLRGDVSVFAISTQRVINATADVGYQLNSSIGFIFGYRYLEIDFQQDDLLYDVTLNGMHLGVSIHF